MVLRLLARRSGPWLLVVTALTSACSDVAPTPPATAAAPAHVASSTVPTVEEQINALFPNGLRSAAQARWQIVKSHYGSGADADRVTLARRQMFLLVDWTLAQEPRLNTGSMLTALLSTTSVSPAVSQLIAAMYAYVYPNVPLPPSILTGDAVIGVVFPSAPATIVTPAGFAGIAIQAGSVAEPMLLVIQEKAGAAGAYAAACSGPLPTTLCQYPLFYEFHPFPYQVLLQPARAGVCYPTSGPRAPDALTQPRLRLAHQAPVPSAVLGYVHEGIEVLPHAHVDDFLSCDDVEFTPVPVISEVRNPLVRGGLRLLAGAGSSAWRALAPKPLYAYDRGGGGELLAFSDFNIVDTLVVAAPDLQIGSTFTFYRGAQGGNPDTLTIEQDTLHVPAYPVLNSGTAGAPASQVLLRVSPDTTLTTADAGLGGSSSTPALPPGHTIMIAAQYVALPSTLAHGVRWIGALVDPGDSIPETNEANNFVSKRTVLVYPGITFETYPGGATACSSCGLDAQYSTRATTFSFIPTGGAPEPAWLRQTDASYAGDREATAPVSASQTAVLPKQGELIMTFAPGVGSVRFTVRVPIAEAQPPIAAEDHLGAPISYSVTVVTTTTDRIFTVTAASAAGVKEVAMTVAGTHFPHVDDVLLRP